MNKLNKAEIITGNDVTYLVHGFNVIDDGKSTIQKFYPYLRAENKGAIINWQYGWFGLFSVLFRNKAVAKKIMQDQNKRLKIGCRYAVGHSNGCAIIFEAARQGAHFDCVLLINPALKVNVKIPDNIKRVIIVYTKHDVPTRTARMLDKTPFIQLLIPNSWGAMGAVGYNGYSKNVENIDTSAISEGHSDLFNFENMQAIAPKLARKLYNKSNINLQS